MRELAPRLLGARIERVHQYAGDLALKLWVPPGRHLLILSSDPAQPIVALLDSDPIAPRRHSSLLEAVRSRLVGGRITSMEAIAGDRIGLLDITRAEVRHRLVFELMRPAPAIRLLDSDHRVIAQDGPGASRNGTRPGLLYELPIRPHRDDPTAGWPGHLRREALTRAELTGESVAAARAAIEALAATELSPRLYPTPSGGLVASPIRLATSDVPGEPFPDMVALVAALYQRGVLEDRIERGRLRLLRALRQRRERLARDIARCVGQATAGANSSQLRESAELLLAYQHQASVTDGAASIPHPQADGEHTVIQLPDPRQSLVENAQLLFKRYRKATRTVAQAAQRQTELEQHLHHIEELTQAVTDATWGELPALEDELKAERILAAGAVPGRRQPSGRSARLPGALSPRRYTASNGAAILVGRSSRANDHLTFQVAGDLDFWLHATGPGAHVVLRNPEGLADPDPAALREAAGLAAWYSKRSGGAKVEVMWTQRRFVTRVPGAPPGLVRLRRHSSIRVDPAQDTRSFDLEGGGEPC